MPAPEELGFLRVAVAAPELRVADVAFNARATAAALRALARQGVRLAVFPELGLTGYTCGDLFFQNALREAARRTLLELAPLTAELGLAAIVGLPWEHDGRLYNAAALLAGGHVAGLVPKTHLPNYNEYYERRWFAPAGALPPGATTEINRHCVHLGNDLLFRCAERADWVLGIEICEDLWAASPPSGALALAGATVLANPSASSELLAKAAYRRDLVRQQSARCLAAYLYAGAGPGESSTDLVFSGHGIIAENGAALAETERFAFATRVAVADLDLDHLRLERMKNSTFANSAPGREFREVEFSTGPARYAASADLRRPVPARPFVPEGLFDRAAHCEEIFSLQATGLATRLRHTGAKNAVLGVSGGLDSALALLVAVRAFDTLGLDRRGLLGVSMPGLGTTDRTQSNAEKLVAKIGATLRVVPIREAVLRHFADIGHDPKVHDVTFENAQARERTQVLMDLANSRGGFVIGTGDLSELALGWCTFNADHMSMYHVNAGVPKTLVRHLIAWVAESQFSGAVADVLRDVLDTPVSPELLPPGENGALRQKTEATIGPYELHDFYLYHTVRLPFRPAKVLFLAERAWGEKYPRAALIRWLEVFYRRFFAAQFKRSAMPDGPKVGSVALSPRGDWRMPSDAAPDVWLAELAATSRAGSAAAKKPRKRAKA